MKPLTWNLIVPKTDEGAILLRSGYVARYSKDGYHVNGLPVYSPNQWVRLGQVIRLIDNLHNHAKDNS